MSILVRHSRIDSRSARHRLAAQREPYWRKFTRGCYLGYRRSRTEGTWIARCRDETGKQLFQALGQADDVLDANGTSALSFEQAQERARDWFAQIERNGSEGRKPGVYTVADCMTDYLEWLKQHRKSYRHIKVYSNAYILPKLGRVDTKKLTTNMIRKWQQDLSAEPPRLRTKKGKDQRYRKEDENPKEATRKRRLRANRHLVILRAALNRAWREGRITHRDAWDRVSSFPGVEAQRSRFLDRDEAKRLFNACPSDLRKLVQLALLSGARYGELCAFDVRDYQVDSGTLFIRDSKSGKPRHVVLNAEGTQLCRELVVGRSMELPLLTKADGARWSRDHHRRPFKEAVKAASLDPSFTFHELRHTWASLTIMAGAPLMVVAQNLGHRDTRMVEKHYGHLTQSYFRETIRNTSPSFGIVADTKIVPLTG
jgi:integrase